MDTQVLKQQIRLLPRAAGHTLGSAARTCGTFAINTPGGFLAGTSAELLPSLLPKPAESSAPGAPRTQSPGPGVPGEQPDPGGPQAGAREHTDTGNRRNSPRAHPPPFPKVSRCCWTKSGCHTEQPLPPSNRVQAPRASPAPRCSRAGQQRQQQLGPLPEKLGMRAAGV